MNLVEIFLRHPVKVSVGVLLVALFGGISLFALPMQLTPEVEQPTLSIQTRWPGASPQEIEREIVAEQEEQLKSVEGVVKMSSECRDSSGQITLEFRAGTDMAEALVKVNARLQQVREYPEDADEPVLSTAQSSDRPIAWFVLRPRTMSVEEIEALQSERPEWRELLEPVRRAGGEGLRLRRLRAAAEAEPALAEYLPPDQDLGRLRRFAREVIEARFERVPGVANANVLGGREDELQVVVDPQALAARQLSVLDLRNALRARNVDTSGGDFWEGKRRWVVRTLGQFRDPTEVENVVVSWRDGIPVYVRDVARVQLDTKKASGAVRNFGVSAIAVNCLRDKGANVLDVMDGLRVAVDELDRGVLARRGLKLLQVYDETDYIDSAIRLVVQNLVVGGLLTVLVLLLFLRSGRSTLVIGLAIPTSVIGTFLLLQLLGRSLNVISMAGLAFAVGMLVDNAVVVLENVYRHAQAGRKPFDAAVRGTQEVWGAVFASTATTLAVFLPVLFIQEESGQLFRDIAIAISGAVGLSLAVSVVVIPVACSRLLTRDGSDGRTRRVVAPLLKPVDALARGFVARVSGAVRWMGAGLLRQLAVVGGLLLLAFGGAVALLPQVEYLPTGNRNLVFGILLPPSGYNLDELLRLGEEIDQKLQPYWDVDPGTPEAAALDHPPIGDFFFVATGSSVFLGARCADPERAGELVPLLQGVTFQIPGMFAVVKQTSLFEQGLTSGRTVDVEITGPDLEHLVELGGRVLGGVRQVLPDAQALPRPSLDLSNPELHVLPRWEHAADLGVTASELGYTVNALVDGAYATDYFLEGNEVDLTILGAPRSVRRTQDLEQLPVATASGRLVPLSSVADVVLASGPEQIHHRERQRAVTIEVTPPTSVPLEEAMDRIQREIVDPLFASGAVDGTTSIHLAGTADKLRATWRSLRFNLVLAVLIIYLLMAGLFESWIMPLVIIVSVPLGAVGGLLGLKILDAAVQQPLDVLTMLGFVILIGTVVNNAILIVHQSLQQIRGAGQSALDAVVESVRVRVRPIFMTTFTTVFGLLPLVLFPGAGSELYRGLGSVILGGLLVSSLFTLLLVPALFLLAVRLLPLGLASSAAHGSVHHPPRDPSPAVRAPRAGAPAPLASSAPPTAESPTPPAPAPTSAARRSRDPAPGPPGT